MAEESLIPASLQSFKSYQKVLSGLVIIHAIVQCRGVRGAAEALGYKSASAVSNRIKRLEKVLGGRAILEHIHSGTYRLTPEGEELSGLAENIVREFVAFIARKEKTVLGLRIASITSVWNTNNIKARFESGAGNKILDPIKFIDHTNDIIKAVHSGSVDLGIVTYPPKRRELGKLLVHKKWKNEQMVMVVSADNKNNLGAGGDHSWGKPNLLNEFPSIVLTAEYGVRQEIDRYLNKKKVSMTVAAEFNAISAITEMLASGSNLMSILPLPTVRENSRLHWSYLEDLEKRPVGFVFRKEHREIVDRFLVYFPPENDEEV